MTSAEYAALLARRGYKVVPAKPAPQRESDLHEIILADCRRRGWIALHGSMAHRSHRTIGEPDFLVLADAGRVLLIECKRPGGKQSSEQLALAAWAARLGHTVHVIDSFTDYARIIGL